MVSDIGNRCRHGCINGVERCAECERAENLVNAPTESFAGHPRTVGEIRSDRAMDCSKWAPRDVLISMLRKIDAEELDPKHLVVLYREEGSMHTGWWMSSPDPVVVIGMLAQTSGSIAGNK